MKVFILNLLEPTNMCQCFLHVLAQTIFSPHFLLNQRLRENTNGDVLYSSLQSSRKLPAHVLPEGELWDQRPFFTKEFLTKSALTMYAAQTGLSPPLTPSPFTLMTSHKVHVFIIPVLQLENEAQATELKPALCEQTRNWTQGHVIPCPLYEEGSNLHEKPPSGKREGRRTHGHWTPVAEAPDFGPGRPSSPLWTAQLKPVLQFRFTPSSGVTKTFLHYFHYLYLWRGTDINKYNFFRAQSSMECSDTAEGSEFQPRLRIQFLDLEEMGLTKLGLPRSPGKGRL